MKSGRDRFEFANKAAAAGERDGFLWLGICYDGAEGCVVDFASAKANYLRSAELGNVAAMCEAGDLVDDNEPLRWRLWCRAAVSGLATEFLDKFKGAVLAFMGGSGSPASIFMIGRVLQGRINREKKEIMGSTDAFSSSLEEAQLAVVFFEAQVRAAKEAVHAWSLIAVRCKIVKDVRKLINERIWEMREEGLFPTSLA